MGMIRDFILNRAPGVNKIDRLVLVNSVTQSDTWILQEAPPDWAQIVVPVKH